MLDGLSSIRRKYFTVVRRWNRLPSEVMDASFLEVFKALANLIYWVPTEGGLELDHLPVSFQPISFQAIL